MDLNSTSHQWADLKGMYASLHQWSNGNEGLLAAAGIYLAWNIAWWCYSCMFLPADLYGCPKWMNKYKIQQNISPYEGKLVFKALKVAFLYHVVMLAVLAYPLYHVLLAVGCRMRPEDTPALTTALAQLPIFMIIRDAFFFYFHWALHHKSIYKSIHKMHHLWTAPIAVASTYSHPLEIMGAYVVPVILATFLLQAHIVTVCLWLPCMACITINHHNGYHLPFFPSAEHHDFHHLKFDVNYGTWGILDWIHGTDVKYHGTPQQKRDWPLIGFTPMAVRYPDVDNKDKQK